MHGVVEYDISPVRGPLANAFVILINALFFNVKLIGITNIYPKDISYKLLNEELVSFDFIIVGSGAAGCALANQLTEIDKWTVLLIEAGDYPSPTSEVPGLHTTLIRSMEDWQFLMDKDYKSCKARLEERCVLSKGKVLGGTSTINDLLYIRGNYEDYDTNEFEFWNGEVAYKIFHHLENFTGIQTQATFEYGKDGFINLELINKTEFPKDILLDLYRQTKYGRMPRRKRVGVIEHLHTIKAGERFNMAKAFLSSIADRPNLFFTKRTEVQAVTVAEPIDKRADGVNVSIDGVTFPLRAKKEVILTAGAINNAKLLLLSGIGGKKYLTDLKMPTYVNIPAVGQNLMFHLTLPVFVAIETKYDDPNNYYSEINFMRDTADYILERTGTLRYTNIQDFVSYINPKKNNTGSASLAIHHKFFKIGDRNLMSWVEAMNYHPKIINSLLNYNKDRGLILFLITLLRPQSRGEVLLNTTHFHGNPIIKGNFFSDEYQNDYANLVAGFSYVHNLTYLTPKNVIAEFVDLNLPDCRNFKYCSQAYVKCYVQSMAYPNHNVAGTTKMGPECDQTAVVQESLEVRSMRCLRVADSSVLNTMTTGGTVATDAMIGFRLGEILKEKWLKNFISPFHKVE